MSECNPEYKVTQLDLIKSETAVFLSQKACEYSKKAIDSIDPKDRVYNMQMSKHCDELIDKIELI